MRVRRLVGKLLLGLVSLGLGLLVVNALLAWWVPLDTLFQPDDELLFTTRPGARRVTMMDERVGGEWIPIRLNEDGMRGPSLAELDEQRGTRRRILVLGDSMVFGENVREDATFVHRLALECAALGQPTQTVNAGVTGYGPDQALLKLERDFDRVKPDAVLLVLCATNDFGDLVRNKLFELDEAGELVPFANQLDPLALEAFAAAERDANRPALVRLWSVVAERRQARAGRRQAGSGAPDYIAEYLLAARAHFMEISVARDPRVYSLFEDIYDADVAIHPDWPSARAKIALMRALLRRYDERCAAWGIPWSVLVVPSAVDLCEDFAVRVDQERWPSYSPDRLAGTLVELCEELEVPVVDLTQPFQSAGAKSLFVGADDFHWNAAGQALAARVNARELVGEPR